MSTRDLDSTRCIRKPSDLTALKALNVAFRGREGKKYQKYSTIFDFFSPGLNQEVSSSVLIDIWGWCLPEDLSGIPDFYPP